MIMKRFQLYLLFTILTGWKVNAVESAAVSNLTMSDVGQEQPKVSVSVSSKSSNVTLSKVATPITTILSIKKQTTTSVTTTVTKVATPSPTSLTVKKTTTTTLPKATPSPTSLAVKKQTTTSVTTTVTKVVTPSPSSLTVKKTTTTTLPKPTPSPTSLTTKKQSSTVTTTATTKAAPSPTSLTVKKTTLLKVATPSPTSLTTKKQSTNATTTSTTLSKEATPSPTSLPVKKETTTNVTTTVTKEDTPSPTVTKTTVGTPSTVNTAKVDPIIATKTSVVTLPTNAIAANKTISSVNTQPSVDTGKIGELSTKDPPPPISPPIVQPLPVAPPNAPLPLEPPTQYQRPVTLVMAMKLENVTCPNLVNQTSTNSLSPNQVNATFIQTFSDDVTVGIASRVPIDGVQVQGVQCPQKSQVVVQFAVAPSSVNTMGNGAPLTGNELLKRSNAIVNNFSQDLKESSSPLRQGKLTKTSDVAYLKTQTFSTQSEGTEANADTSSPVQGEVPTPDRPQVAPEVLLVTFGIITVSCVALIAGLRMARKKENKVTTPTIVITPP